MSKIRNLSPTDRKVLGSEAIEIINQMIHAINTSAIREETRKRQARLEKRKLKKGGK